MTNTITPTSLQFTRGILKLDEMNAYVVPILEFPFDEMLDILMEMRVILDEQNGKNNKFKKPPTGTLNDFLQFLVPGLSHPFIQNYDEPRYLLPRSGKSLYPMPALGIPQLVSEQRYEPIPPDLLRQIVNFWLDVVIADTTWYFKNGETKQQQVIDHINLAKQSVNNAKFTWDYIPVGDLWQERRERSVGYRALRSLLATQFITSSQSSPIEIDGEQLVWRAAHEEDSLVPVTQALQHRDGSYYAYTMNLIVRDMPGREEPLIYFMPRIRRYMSKPISYSGANAVRVMIEYPSPLSKTLKVPVSFITQVPVRIVYSPKGYFYKGHVLPMLEKLVGNTDAHKALIAAQNLADMPQEYVKPRPGIHEAAYLMVYNAEMSPNPTIHAGLPMPTVKQLYHATVNYLEGWMQAETAHPTLTFQTLSTADIEKGEYLSLVSLVSIKDYYRIWIGSRKPQVKHREWIPLIHERFQLALNEKTLVVLLFADTENALTAMENDVRGVLAILDEKIPEGVEIHQIRTPTEFIFKINEISEQVWRRDVGKIQESLKQLKDVNGQPIQLISDKSYVAIVQRPIKPESQDDRKLDDQKKSALRAALGSMQIRSQMIRPFPDEDNKGLQNRKYFTPKTKTHESSTVERGRLMHTVSDALIRGIGMTYGPPSQHYVSLLGFEPSLAENIVVEYWVRHRVRKPKTDFIAVVRQHANGYIDVILPNTKNGKPEPPRSVHELGWYLQTLFAKAKESDRVYTQYENTDVPDDRVMAFFQSQLRDRDVPTLIVPQVGDWQSRGTEWFSDAVVEENQVSLGDFTKRLDDLKNIRVVKMLTDVRFNMRYWLGSANDDFVNIGSLVAVRDKFADVPTVYSIDSREEDSSDSSDSDLESLYQRGRVVEFASLIMQPDDSLDQQYAWCSIPHLARIHPGWSMGATIYPYPYHVVCNAIDDALWAVFAEKR
jgi:hypothetical protein